MTSPSPLEAIFFAALERPTPADRAAYLDEACGSDAELRRQVERLLAAHPNVGSFLESPAPGLPQTVDTGVAIAPVRPASEAEGGAPLEAAGNRIGSYQLLEVLGAGGMGTVWLAEQTAPVQRQVTLKVI